MSTARVRWISGPVLRATCTGAFALREAVTVGADALLGEVVRMDGNDILVQVYEDTVGLRPGVQVHGSGTPLAVPLGPGLLGGMYDGLLRPLGVHADGHVRAGMALQGASTRHYDWSPEVEPGQHIRAGQLLGRMRTPDGPWQRLLCPPDRSGVLLSVAAAGSWLDNETMATISGDACAENSISMRQYWPVREPRPVRRRLPSDTPLVTGQRILDSLFPIALGGKAAIPGGFGTGKTVLLEALARGCSADVIVYLGCGERGNEIAGVLEEFPHLKDPRSGLPLMQRTVIIANTSNMPVAAREASIYTAVTVAEYFRDQGLHVALMADSTSRWAEALREVSGRFGELPGEGGYPAYLASRLADFYERAARVETLSGSEGSVTLIGAISPPSGDLSEPVTSHTKRYVKAFWTLDVKRAQARAYPAVHPLQSYSEDACDLQAWWAAAGNDRWWSLRKRFLELLEEQSRLQRMARIIGTDALPPRQQLVLLSAELLDEAFLRQSAFSPIDRVANPTKQGQMMHLLAHWMDLAERALQAGTSLQALAAMPSLRSIKRMGAEIPNDEPDHFIALRARIESEFDALLAPIQGGADARPAAG